MFVKNLIFQITLCFVGLFQSYNAIRNPIRTKCGEIEGTVLQYNGKKVPAFLGIPYAQPPVGDLRFEKTVPVTPWPVCLQATHVRPACLQHHPPDYPWVDNSTLQSEDCLYLNIYVPPKTCNCSKKAVMFWMFSGGFSYGSGNLPVYDGRVLAAEGDVIVVTVNYRINILGFFSSGGVPGYMGLHDVLEALKWVKENIAAFGGDPNKITLFGHSAGGIAAGLLCVSPQAKGLFKGIIMQSGSAAQFSNNNKENNDKLAKEVTQAFGCDTDDFVRCLKTKNARELVDVTHVLSQSIIGFSTIVGDDILPVDPQTQLKTGLFSDVDILMGFVQDEGSIVLCVQIDTDFFGYFGYKNKDFNKTTGEIYIRKMVKSLPVHSELLIQYYLGNVKENDYEKVREQTYHVYGDFALVCPTIYFGESYANKGKSVYAYYFNHIRSFTPWPHWVDSTHFDEVAFTFGRPVDHPSYYSSEEIKLSRTLLEAWTNFAKYGCPGKKWSKFSRSKPYIKVFNISNRKSYLEDHKKNCEFLRPIIGFP